MIPKIILIDRESGKTVTGNLNEGGWTSELSVQDTRSLMQAAITMLTLGMGACDMAESKPVIK